MQSCRENLQCLVRQLVNNIRLSSSGNKARASREAASSRPDEEDKIEGQVHREKDCKPT